MNIAVLMGSPRKRDSLSLCKEIEKGIGMKGIIYNYIFLKDYRIEDCKGCDQCFTQSEKKCPCKDEIDLMRKLLIEADGIIFATPVYAYQVPAPLKRVIDRLAFLFHRQELVGKPALIVVTSDGGGHKQVSQYMKMTASGWGCHLLGAIQVIAPRYFQNRQGESAWGFSEKYYNKTQISIQRLSDAFSAAIRSQKPKIPSYYDIFMFNCLRSKTFTSTADYLYWENKGWLQSHYFYDTKLSLLKKIFGVVLKKIVNIAGSYT